MSTLRLVMVPMAVALLAAAPLTRAAEATYTAHLAAAAVVPEPTKSSAEATVELKVNADGKQVGWVVTVTKPMNNVSEVDLYLGPTDANGPLVVKLFPKGEASAKKGEFTGLLGQGTFSAADLTGPLQGSPLSDYIDELKIGNSYVKIRSNNGVAGAPPGPGNYRLGEIRGQLKP
ncbi:MAG TPA: CHRD domain-containing protein [Steroidobacteraceae bacterium]|nr:CHRD domain-containing protein [Steroidobacteraceae bacterium]